MAGWKADLMKQEYIDEVLPMFKTRYAATSLPTEIQVWDGNEVHGGAFDKIVSPASSKRASPRRPPALVLE
ncbi:MAG: hypothetical protein ABI193_20905 [Minicystis sp.]